MGYIAQQAQSFFFQFYSDFEIYTGTVGQVFGNLVLDNCCFTNGREASEQVAKELLPGLARLFACSLNPYPHSKCYWPPRWTSLCEDDGTGPRKMLVWKEYGAVKPAPVKGSMDLNERYHKDRTIFQDSFTTTDMHDFGYVHDQVLLWKKNFHQAVSMLLSFKKATSLNRLELHKQRLRIFKPGNLQANKNCGVQRSCFWPQTNHPFVTSSLMR